MYSPYTNNWIPANSTNYTQGRQRPIRCITIHHMAGNLSIEQCGSLWQNPSRNGSSHYGIGTDGRIGCYVDEMNTAWTNSNWNSNCESITIETANDQIGGDWHVSDYALNSLIRLVADISKRHNLGKLVKGQNLTWHSMFTATTCPGPYLMSKLDYIIDEANKINGQSGEPVDQVLHVGSKVVFNGVFKVDEILPPSSLYPNGAVGTYATCYGRPVGINDYIPCGPLATCYSNGTGANYNGILVKGGYWRSDNVFQVIGIELPTRYTPNGVAILNADGKNFRVDCGPLKEV